MSHTYSQTGTQTYAQTHGQTGTQTYGHESHVLDDRDILTDLLLCGKQLLSAYGTATIECTNPQLRQTLQQISKSEADFHTKAFEMMQQRGWYETPRSDAQLAGQIASLWTQKMQRQPGGNHHQHQQHQHQYGQQHQQYGNQTQSQNWHQHAGDSSSWQQGRGGQAGGQGNQPWNWQTGQAAAKTWDAGRSSAPGTIPGAYT